MIVHISFVSKYVIGHFIFEFVRTQVFLLQTSIAIVSTLLNGINYCDQVQIILSNINPIFAQSEVVSSLDINSYCSIQHYLFICAQLNGSKYSWFNPRSRHTKDF